MKETPNTQSSAELDTSFAHLNTAQKEAVFHSNGPCLVIAGAGTGKTSVLTSRMVYLIRQGLASSDQILAVTFTDKAAEEMRERVDQMMELGYQEVNISTFHGLCEKILRERGFEIGIDPQFKILAKHEQYAFLKKRLFQLPLDYYRPLGNPTKFIDVLLSYFSRLKDEDVDPTTYATWAEKKMEGLKEDDEHFAEARKHQELAMVYAAYQQAMIENNSLDFNDLISYALRLLRTRKSVLREYQQRFRYVMVDEFQDTNYTQSILMYLLAGEHQNIMVVGDDDQSIYRFRGASVSNILQFQEHFPKAKKVVLIENYRSRKEILDLAYRSICHNNPDRLEVRANISKELQACSELNQKDVQNSVSFLHSKVGADEVQTIVNEIIRLVDTAGYNLRDIALLFRSNAGMEPFVQAFEKQGVPFKICSQRSLFDQAIVKDLMAVLTVLARPYDDIAWFRVLRMEVWGIPMEVLITFLHTLEQDHSHIWSKISDLLAADSIEGRDPELIFKELMDYSRQRNVGEVLHNFVHKIELFQTLQAENTPESYESISYVSQFFEIVTQFAETHQDDSINDFIQYIKILQETRDIPSTQLEFADSETVSLLTAHGSKGLEFAVVFVPNLVNGRFPTYKRAEPLSVPEELIKEILPEGDFHQQEERRLFYVACTRAKEKLYLSWSEHYKVGSSRKHKRSIFIDEIFNPETVMMESSESAQGQLQEAPSLLSAGSLKHGDFSKVNYSQLQCYENCPRQFEYRYVLKIPQKPSSALSFGSTLHNTLNKFYKLISQHQIQSKQTSLFEENTFTDLLPLSLETLLSMYEESWIPFGYDSPGHLEKRKKFGIEVLTKYYETFKDYFGKPLYLEKSFTLPVGQYRLTGRIDRVDSLDQTDHIVEIFDYKTGKAKSQKDVDKDLQLTIYAMAAQEIFRKEVAKLSLYFLNDNLKVETTRTPEQIEKAKVKIMETIDQMNTRNFEPKPDQMKCKHCDFNSICDAAKF